jgi:hypothetical protein
MCVSLPSDGAATANVREHEHEHEHEHEKTAEMPKATQAPPKKRFKKRTGTTRERTGCLTCRQR